MRWAFWGEWRIRRRVASWEIRESPIDAKSITGRNHKCTQNVPFCVAVAFASSWLASSNGERVRHSVHWHTVLCHQINYSYCSRYWWRRYCCWIHYYACWYGCLPNAVGVIDVRCLCDETMAAVVTIHTSNSNNNFHLSGCSAWWMPARALPRIPSSSDRIGWRWPQLWHCRRRPQRCRLHCNCDLSRNSAQTYCYCWYRLIRTNRLSHKIVDRFVWLVAIAAVGAATTRHHGERWYLDRCTSTYDYGQAHRWRRSSEDAEALENIRSDRSATSMANNTWCFVCAALFDGTIQTIWYGAISVCQRLLLCEL